MVAWCSCIRVSLGDRHVNTLLGSSTSEFLWTLKDRCQLKLLLDQTYLLICKIINFSKRKTITQIYFKEKMQIFKWYSWLWYQIHYNVYDIFLGFLHFVIVFFLITNYDLSYCDPGNLCTWRFLILVWPTWNLQKVHRSSMGPYISKSSSILLLLLR